jgi:hypothetical protein
MMQLRPVVGEVSLLHSTLSPVALLLYRESAHSDVGLERSGQGSNGFYQRCAGVPACIARASLPASSCPFCWCCAGIVAELAFEVWPVPRKRLPALCLRFAHIPLVSLPASFCHPCHRHCAGIIAMLRGRFFPCRAGIFVLIAFASPPASQPDVCPVTKQSQHVLASLPTPRPHRCQSSASIVALVTWALLPL